MTRKSAIRKRQIEKMRADIARIEKSFYSAEHGDQDQIYFELQRIREQLLRSIILEVHLSLESVLTRAIGNALLRGRLIRSPIGHMLRDLLEDQNPLGFRHKLMLARSLNLVTPREFADLAELNTIRNKCSHTWLLNRVRRRGIKRSKPKRPLLRYRGTNLYQTDAFIEFVDYFSAQYLKIWLRHA